jgi:L-iditol 2-dehydrogenase
VNGTMKVGVLTGTRKAEVHEVEIPKIAQPDEVLVNNRACNICTTDYQQWLGLRPQQGFPMAFGHENSGVVVEVGSEVKNVEIGDHVGFGFLGCGECENCRKGKNANLCDMSGTSSFKVKDKYGYYGPRGAAQYKVAKSRELFKLGNDLSFEEAGFLEPLATVVQGIQRLQSTVGDKILVIGAGTMGLLNAQVARLYGANVVISDTMDKKLNTARSLGFDKVLNALDDNYMESVKSSGGEEKGPDAIIIAVGASKAYEQAFKMAPKGCRFLIFAAGYPAPKWDVDPNSVHYNLWDIIGTFGTRDKDFQLACELLRNRQVNVRPLVEAKFKLEDIQEAFEKAATVGNYRVSLTISE